MNKLIYDIGMHTGKDTEFYLKKGFNVVAIEADYSLVEQAKLKFKDELASGQLVIVPMAIAPKGTSEIEFYINNDKDDWGTALPDWNRSMNDNFRQVKVKAIQLESIIEQYGVPYYMKIDIEGSDILCLKSLLNIQAMPDYISIELNTPNNFVDKKIDCLEILSLLSALGYKKFKISDQSKNGEQRSPNPPLEGNFVDFDFAGDSSGLFGKELNLPEFSLDEVAKMYLDYFYNSKKNEPESSPGFFHKIGLLKNVEKDNSALNNIFHIDGWFDIHAIKN